LKGWKAPQQDVKMTFKEFLDEAVIASKHNLRNTARVDENERNALHYMTISAHEGMNTPWIRDSLPFFSDKRRNPSNFFIVDPTRYFGTNCRFGMRGVVAAAHYDGQRNFVAMVKGRKRYVLLPPSECDRLDLLPRNHPSARHSEIDWSDNEQVR
jgi:hypothetical protein